MIVRGKTAYTIRQKDQMRWSQYVHDEGYRYRSGYRVGFGICKGEGNRPERAVRGGHGQDNRQAAEGGRGRVSGFPSWSHRRHVSVP